MNRIISRNLDEIRDDTLPPREGDGRVRMLFLSTQTHGLKSWSHELERATAGRDDVDAVHIRLEATPLMKTLARRAAFLHSWDFHIWRNKIVWAHAMRPWFRDRLPLDRFDVVHCLTHILGAAPMEAIDAMGADAPALAVALDSTTICNSRDLPYENSSPQHGMLKAFEREIFAKSSLVNCMSEWARRSIIEDYGIADPGRSVACPMGTQIPETWKDYDAPREPDRPVRLVMVGNPWGRKGGPRLLRWHQEHWKDTAELHVVCKDAPLEDAPKNVVWHPFVERDTLIGELLPSMDVFVLPTHRDQGSWVIAEAASVGLPSVGTRMAGIPDVCVHGQTGYLCGAEDEGDFVDRISELIADADLRERMGRAARAFAVEKLDRDRVHKAAIDRLVEIGRERRGGVARAA